MQMTPTGAGETQNKNSKKERDRQKHTLIALKSVSAYEIRRRFSRSVAHEKTREVQRTSNTFFFLHEIHVSMHFDAVAVLRRVRVSVYVPAREPRSTHKKTNKNEQK